MSQKRYFYIGANGIAIRRALGAKTNSNRSVDTFSLRQLEKIYDQLSFLKLHGTFKVSQRMLSLVSDERNKKRLEEFRRKNKM